MFSLYTCLIGTHVLQIYGLSNYRHESNFKAYLVLLWIVITQGWCAPTTNINRFQNTILFYAPIDSALHILEFSTMKWMQVRGVSYLNSRNMYRIIRVRFRFMFLRSLMDL